MSESVHGPYIKTQLLRELRARRRIVYKLAWMLAALWALASLPLLIVSGLFWLAQACVVTCFILAACSASPRLWRAIKGWRQGREYGMSRGRALGWAWKEFWASDV